MSSVRESLLDRFPLRNNELDRLLSSFDLCKTVLLEESSTFTLSDYLLKEEYTEVIRSVEQEVFPELSRIFQQEFLDTVVVGVSQLDQPELYEKAKFLEACVTLMGRGNQKALSERLYKAFGDDCSPARIADFIIRLAKAAYVLDFRLLPSREINHARLLETITESLSNVSPGDTEIQISQTQFSDWLEGQAKSAVKLLSTVFHFALLGATLIGTNRLKDSFSNPRYVSTLFDWITGSERQSHELDLLSSFWKQPFDPVPFQLSLMGLGGPWFQRSRRLYNSDEDGLAFSSFAQALVSFMGPTLVLIQTTEREVIGFYTELPWKKGPKWYTAHDESLSQQASRASSMLFRVQPSWNCYNMISRGRESLDGSLLTQESFYPSSKPYHQFLSTPVSYRRGQGPLEGLAIGGIASDAPRLHLHPTLERCYAGSMDTTFEPGPLLSNERNIDTAFDVDALEVWAIRSESFSEDLAAGKLKMHLSVNQCAASSPRWIKASSWKILLLGRL